MTRNSHNPRGSSTYARNQTSRWRGIILMLVLTFSLGSWGQPAQAQEADPDVSVHTVLNASIPPAICVNEIGTVEVKVIRTLKEIDTKWAIHFERLGINIDATSDDSDIASLINTHAVTGFDSAGDDGLAHFDYRGEKAGTTNLNFEARQGHTLITGESFERNGIAQVTVEDCKIKVNVTSKWQSSGGQVSVKIEAKIKEADLLPTDTKGTYEGKAKVKWTGTGSTKLDCASEFSAVSDADLKGTLDESGWLLVTVQYKAADLRMATMCKNSEGEAPGQMGFASNASPVRMRAKLETGGVSSPVQTLSTLEEMIGTAFIEVWQEKPK